MPIFISSEDEFFEAAKRAVECRVKRIEKKGIAKVKARTKRYLYTYVVALDKLDGLLNKLKNICTVKEL
ncbi:MAG: 5'-nucleotidase [Ignisphaera sp.]|nr:5'-nucleotidase [Ignisphaera sp.]MCX8167403.1 5'-nucleotidase [Ignisphaera sp.]MDW8085941.1 5'-nucleotidase [Ignisphaera sp.]